MAYAEIRHRARQTSEQAHCPSVTLSEPAPNIAAVGPPATTDALSLRGHTSRAGSRWGSRGCHPAVQRHPGRLPGEPAPTVPAPQLTQLALRASSHLSESQPEARRRGDSPQRRRRHPPVTTSGAGFTPTCRHVVADVLKKGSQRLAEAAGPDLMCRSSPLLTRL